MPQTPIYLDNHATTRVDPRVVEAMLPFFTQTFGNAGSTTHSFGWEAKQAADSAREVVAAAVGAKAKELIFTSGATESNNLALRGVAERYQNKGRHIVSVVTEHPSVLDPLARLGREGFEITLLPVISPPDPQAGRIRLEQVEAALRSDTILVSVMAANNEIGTRQPLAELGHLCRQRGVLLHTDATQAVGRIPIDVDELQVDLLSFTAHKLYGPKGVGALYVRRRAPAVRLQALLDGGGQEWGLRSGTLNVPGMVGFARAVELCQAEMSSESVRLRQLRDHLYAGLSAAVSGVTLNGPALSPPEWRLAENLNVSFAGVDGEALLMHAKDLALSSGSACTSEHPEPSYVLRSLGVSEEAARSSIRFGLGRFNTAEEVDFAIGKIAETVGRLRRMIFLGGDSGPLA
jgi:cysteine desulfurase